MSTLAEVTGLLQQSLVTQQDTKENMVQLREAIESQIDFIKGQAGDELEEKKKAERARRKGSSDPVAGSLTAMVGEIGDTFKGTFLGAGLAGIASKLLGIIKAPFAALSFLWRYKGLFLKAGVIFTAIYEVFKDIGDNPTFQTSLENIKQSWTSIKERVTEIYDSLSAMVSEVWNTEGTQVAVGKLLGWFNNLRKQIQDFVSENLSIVFSTIDGVLEGIQLLVGGEWKQGLSKIGTTLFDGIKNSFDSLITNFLQIFGVNFGENGTFLSWLGEQYDYTMAKMIMKFREFRQKINDGWDAVINFFVGEDGYIQTTYNGIKTWIGLKWSNFKSTIETGWANIIDFFTDPEKEGSIPHTYNLMKTAISTKWDELTRVVTVDFPNKISEIVTSIQDKVAGVYDSIMTKIQDLVEVVTGFIPSGEEIKAALIRSVMQIPGGESALDLLGIDTEQYKSPETIEDRIRADQRQFDADREPAHTNTGLGGGTWYGHQGNPSYFADQMEELLAADPNYRGQTGSARPATIVNTSNVTNNPMIFDNTAPVTDDFSGGLS